MFFVICNTVIFNKPRHEQDTLTYRLSVTDAQIRDFSSMRALCSVPARLDASGCSAFEAQTQQTDIGEQAVKKARLQRHVCFTTGSCMFRIPVRGNN